MKDLTKDNKNNNEINKFIKELTELGTKTQEEYDLKSKIEDEISRREFDLLKEYRENTKSQGEMYFVYKKMSNDKYKLGQNVGDQTRLRIFNKNELPNSIKEGDILREQGNKFVLDEKSTNYITQKLKEIEKDVNNELNKN